MISHLEYGFRCSAYQDILDRIDELNRYLIVLDRPRIALPSRARILAMELLDLVPKLSLKEHDIKAISDYVTDADRFCRCYFQVPSFRDQPAVLPLRLPCDSGRLLRHHEALHQRYLKLRRRLEMAL